MRKFFGLIFVLILAALAYVGFAHFSGGAVPTFGLPLGGNKAQIRARTLEFFDHVKFKNASALLNFVAKESTSEEVERYVDRTIGLDSDNADLNLIKIETVELDSRASRARAKLRLAGQDLINKKPFDIEKIIFLYVTPDDQWLIDIKTGSL